MRKKIIPYLKLSLSTLLAFSLNLGCTNQNIVSEKLVKTNNVLNKNKDNTYNFYFDGDSKNTEKNNVKIKLSLDKAFNIKYQLRKRVTDITNIQIGLCTISGTFIGTPFSVNFNNISELRDLTVNIKNLPSGTYYARATARDSGTDTIPGNGDDNILNETNTYDISSNSINVDASFNVTPSNTDLKINLGLKNAARDAVELFITTGSQISNQNIAVDEKGDGFIYFKSNPTTITLIALKNYVQVQGTGSFDFTAAGLTSIDHITGTMSNGKGTLVFVKNFTTKSQLCNKQIILKDNGSLDHVNETVIEEDLSGSDKYRSPHIQLDSKGNGTLVFSKFITGRYNIYLYKYTSYENVIGAPSSFFSDGVSDKTNAKVSIDHNGNGVVVWEDNISGTKEILMARLLNYITFDHGTVTAPTSINVTGVGTKFFLISQMLPLSL